MKVADTYNDAFDFIREAEKAKVIPVSIGVDIGKQFGTRIIMRLDPMMARKLLVELQQRDLPLPQVFYYGNQILIGADPE